MKQVGFIGLGVMGGAMAANLARGGLRVVGHDLDPARREDARKAGIEIAATAAGAVSGACAVITMLPDPAALRAALLGGAEGAGALASMSPGSLLIEMGTSGPDTVAGIAARARKRGIAMIDAPVGRPPAAARDGTLIIIAGGAAEDLERARLLFDIMGEITHHAGPLGAGATLKLINNYMSMVGMVMTAEALAAGAAAGLDRDLLVRVLSGTAAGRGQIIVNYPHKVLAGDITPDFPIRLGLKDLTLALDLGARLGAELCLGHAARSGFQRAIARGRGDQDCTALLLDLEQEAGLIPTALSADAPPTVPPQRPDADTGEH